MIRDVRSAITGTCDYTPNRRAPLRGEFGMVRESVPTKERRANILEHTGMDVHGATPRIAVLDSQGKRIMEVTVDSPAAAPVDSARALRGLLYPILRNTLRLNRWGGPCIISREAKVQIGNSDRRPYG